ncbi:MAG: hypothetical protein N3E45_04010 [Oscillatoriaceae bacterium SKW80]|nr:hypothetical protein [Oscillatoriaceae bacterium SKYG93]MCX8119983.1 hypothetical protein [Oscillatoriaceae bacterium SKW80]MDW8454144.1 hypothetical protein [Oscillatoriaceae cyanobacterium SKYGB_i_bin93]HIK29532.1 hypothetical protein [Oscillatoriaceae cyanobacterium M7585_C2015_266]
MLVRTILVIVFGFTSFLLLLCGFLVTSALVGLSENSEEKNTPNTKQLFIFLIIWGIFLIGGAIAPLFLIEPPARISQILTCLAFYGFTSLGGIIIYIIIAPISRLFNRR